MFFREVFSLLRGQRGLKRPLKEMLANEGTILLNATSPPTVLTSHLSDVGLWVDIMTASTGDLPLLSHGKTRLEKHDEQ